MDAQRTIARTRRDLTDGCSFLMGVTVPMSSLLLPLLPPPGDLQHTHDVEPQDFRDVGPAVAMADEPARHVPEDLRWVFDPFDVGNFRELRALMALGNRQLP